MIFYSFSDLKIIFPMVLKPKTNRSPPITLFMKLKKASCIPVDNLRRKLEPDSARPRHILTAFGAGYRFSDGTDA